MNRLRIYPVSAMEWALIENDQVIESGSGHSFPNADECEVVVPFSLISLATAKLPKVNSKRLLEIAPYAIEDAVISEPEKNLALPLKKLQDDTTLLAVIDRGWMDGLLAELGKSGLEPKRAVPELLLPSLKAGEWALVLLGPEGFLKTSEEAAFSLDCHGQEPPVGLKLALERERPEKILVYSKDYPDLEQWEKMLGIPFRQAGAWDWKKAEFRREINLIGRSASRSFEIDWRPFKPALFILFMMIALQFSGTVYEWIHLSREKKAIFTEMDRLFRQSFPEARVVVDAPLQMKRKLEELRRSGGNRQPGDFIPLMASLSGEIASLPSGSLSSIDYSAEGLDLSAGFPGKDALDMFRKKLESGGLKVELKKVEEKDNGVLATLHVGSGGS